MQFQLITVGGKDGEKNINALRVGTITLGQF